MKMSFYFQHSLFWINLWKLSHTEHLVARRIKKPLKGLFRVWASFICLLSSRYKTISRHQSTSHTSAPLLNCFIYDHYFPSAFFWEKRMQRLKFINSKYPHLKENMSNIFLEWKKRDGHILLSFLCNESWHSYFVLL